jgi:hypothetical protein
MATFEFESLSSNPIGEVTTLLKKGLTENQRNI